MWLAGRLSDRSDPGFAADQAAGDIPRLASLPMQRITGLLSAGLCGCDAAEGQTGDCLKRINTGRASELGTAGVRRAGRWPPIRGAGDPESDSPIGRIRDQSRVSVAAQAETSVITQNRPYVIT